MEAITVHPNTPSTLFAWDKYDNKLLWSSNGGRDWEARSDSLFWNRYDQPRHIAIDPAMPDVLYLGLAYSPGLIYKSVDGGAEFTALLPDQLRQGYMNIINSLVVDESNPATLYASMEGRVYKSSNAGLLWEKSSNGVRDVVNLAIAPSDSSVIYAGTNGHGVYRSSDGGATWSPANKGISTSRETVVAGGFH